MEKISDYVNRKFDSDPIYNNKYINTKIRSYNNDIITTFCNIDNKNNKLPEKKQTVEVRVNNISRFYY